MRALSAIPLVVVLSFAAAAFAQQAPGSTAKVAAPAPEIPINPQQQCELRLKIQTAQIGMLEAALKLAPAQQPVFDNWRKTRLELEQSFPCPPPSTGLKVPAPKRLENQLAIMSQDLDVLHKELPPTLALYDALTSEQRAIFDGPIKSVAPAPITIAK